MVPDADDKNPTGGLRGTRHRLRGPSRIDAPVPAPSPKSVPTKKRVLFVCIGNSCRSQMAEGFARAYGEDILVAQSAGLSPAAIVQPETKQVMAERNVRIDDQYPKGMEILMKEHFDFIINMSGQRIPDAPGARVREWLVRDPIGQKDPVYQAVAEQIEGLVMRLILELRSSTL